MKTITIAGNVGKDAVLRRTNDGTPVLGWGVAVEERNGQDKRTIWFDCSLWGKRGEALAQYITKGTRVAVAGELSTRDHDGKTYLTVRADQVTLLGGGQRSEDSGRDDGGQYAPAQSNALEDDIPFNMEWR